MYYKYRVKCKSCIKEAMRVKQNNNKTIVGYNKKYLTIEVFLKQKVFKFDLKDSREEAFLR